MKIKYPRGKCKISLAALLCHSERNNSIAAGWYGSLLGPLKKYIYFYFFPKKSENLKKKKKLSQDPRSDFFSCVFCKVTKNR